MEHKYLEYLVTTRNALADTIDNHFILVNKSLEKVTPLMPKLQELDFKISKLKEYFELRDKGLEPNINEFIDTYSLKEYVESTLPPVSLFDENIKLTEFLSWFYDEFPFIKDKHLKIVSDGIDVPFGDVPLNNQIYLNHENKTVDIYLDYPNTGKLGSIVFSNLDLYSLVTVAPIEMTQHLDSLAQEEFYAEY